MTDKMRWRYGDTNPVVAAVAAATVIEIGDLLWQDTDNAKPASALADAGNKAANQAAFTAKFLGVAMQRSRAGESAPIRVATTGAFDFDCTSANFELGDLIGVEGNSGGLGLLNQNVAKVTAGSSAVGRIARRAAAATSVLVDVRSTAMTGGVVSNH